MMNKRFERFRQRRQTNFRGKFRGQTQSQYLNIGNGDQKEGKAEAESTQQSSRAVVSKYSLRLRGIIVLKAARICPRETKSHLVTLLCTNV